MKIQFGAQGSDPCQDINSVVVPPHLRVKEPTGIGWLDDALSGGFTPTTSWMLTGDPSCGKSTLARMIADAVTLMGFGVAVYVAGEESFVQVRMALDRLNLRNGFRITEEVDVDDVVARASAIGRESPGLRPYLLIDSLQCLDDKGGNRKSRNTPIRCAQQLTSWAKTTHGVLVFVGHATKGGTFAGGNEILHTVDGWMHLGFDRDRKSETFGERVLSVNKNRFGIAPVKLVVEMGPGGLLQPKPLEGDG